MANEDRILKILLQLQSDVSGLKNINAGIDETKGKLDDAGKSAFSMGDAFKFAGAEEGLRRMLDFIQEIPAVLEEGIQKGGRIHRRATAHPNRDRGHSPAKRSHDVYRFRFGARGSRPRHRHAQG